MQLCCFNLFKLNKYVYILKNRYITNIMGSKKQVGVSLTVKHHLRMISKLFLELFTTEENSGFKSLTTIGLTTVNYIKYKCVHTFQHVYRFLEFRYFVQRTF